MPRLTPDQATSSIDRLRSSIDDIPAASRRSGRGAPSTLDLLDQWSVRIGRNDMEPDALPTLYARQASRHGRDHELSDAIKDEARVLLRLQGKRTGYGSVGYFGRHRAGEDD